MADEALTAGAVARRLGVAVTTLRTWHQRYGLGPSHHVPGQHRRYTPEDMERLQVMRRLTVQGVTPAEAAAWARRVPLPLDITTPADGVAGEARASPPVDKEPTNPGAPARGDLEGMPSDHSRGRNGSVTGDDGDPVFTRADETGPIRGTRDGGGQAIRTGRAGPAARGLARAAMRLDAPALRDILEMTIADRGVIAAWEEVIMPVLVGVGERYALTKRFIEVEHLISRGVTEVLASVTRPPSRQLARVLLAAADEEQHTLPLEALAAALAQAGVSSRLLGARVPPQALQDAVARTGPAAVVIWSQLPGTGNPEQLRHLLTGPHQPLLSAVAGPGWDVEKLPEGLTMLWSLTEAVELVTAAAIPTGRAS